MNLERLVDRWHLRNDVEAAEEAGVRFGDAHRKAEGRLGEHQRQRECTDALLTAIATRHHVPTSAVTAMRGLRPVLVDLAVAVVYDVLFVLLVGRLLTPMLEGVAHRSRVWLVALTTLAGIALGAASVLALPLFGYAVETVRLWDGHISYRSGRLPWEQHPLAVFMVTVALALCTVLLACRASFVRPLSGE